MTAAHLLTPWALAFGVFVYQSLNAKTMTGPLAAGALTLVGAFVLVAQVTPPTIFACRCPLCRTEFWVKPDDINGRSFRDQGKTCSSAVCGDCGAFVVFSSVRSGHWAVERWLTKDAYAAQQASTRQKQIADAEVRMKVAATGGLFAAGCALTALKWVAIGALIAVGFRMCA